MQLCNFINVRSVAAESFLCETQRHCLAFFLIIKTLRDTFLKLQSKFLIVFILYMHIHTYRNLPRLKQETLAHHAPWWSLCVSNDLIEWIQLCSHKFTHFPTYCVA